MIIVVHEYSPRGFFGRVRVPHHYMFSMLCYVTPGI